MMKVLIVEDETAASENLVAMLQEIDSSIEVLHVLESVQQTVRWLSSNPAPDLIFMDIHLSDGSAFSIFEVMEVQTPIVFTTAYDQYALDAFRVNSIGYLLKPIKTADLSRALEKYNRWSRTDVLEYLQKMMALKPATTSSNYRNSLLVPMQDKLLPVILDDVVCIYSKERTTQIYLKDNQVLPFNRSLDSLMSGLDPNKFFRANKQYVISRDYVKEIIVWFDSRLKLEVPVELLEPIFVSKNKAAEFKAWMVK